MYIRTCVRVYRDTAGGSILFVYSTCTNTYIYVYVHVYAGLHTENGARRVKLRLSKM